MSHRGQSFLPLSADVEQFRLNLNLINLNGQNKQININNNFYHFYRRREKPYIFRDNNRMKNN